MNLIKSLSLLSLPLFSFVTAQATTNQGVESEASVIQSPARMGLTKQPVVHETGWMWPFPMHLSPTICSVLV